MDENTAGVVLQTFESHRATKVTEATDKRWKWAAGVLLFPDAICAWCKGSMRSNCIWWVDEPTRQLRAVVGINTDKLIRKPVSTSHPNVSAAGTICTGSAETCYQALFLSWSNHNPYWSASKDWVAGMFDHKCKVGRVIGGLAAEMKAGDKAAKGAAVKAAGDEPIFGIRRAPAALPAIDDDQRIFGSTAESVPIRGATVRGRARLNTDDEPIFGRR